MRHYFTLIFCCFYAICAAQDRQQHNSNVTVRGNIGIPKPFISQMYRTCFTGVYEGNVSVNLRLFGNFYAGVGYQNSHFQNNKKVFVYYEPPPNHPFAGSSLSYNTRLTGHGGFLKLGTDRFFSDKGYMSYSVNTGLMLCQYRNVVLDSAIENSPYPPQTFSTPFFQPEMSANFIVEKRLSFSILLSYTTLLYKFDPKAPRFYHFEKVVKTSNRYYMSWFNIGFGFSILLGKNR